MSGDVGVATTQRAERDGKISKGQVIAAASVSSLEAAGVIAVEVLDEFTHRIELVHRARKAGGEATSGETRCDLGVACSAADGSDPGACENGGVMSDLHFPLSGEWKR